MKNSKDYIEELKEIYGSYYKVAQILNLTTQSVIRIKKGGTIKLETAIKIARALNLDEEEVILSAMIAKSKTDEVREFWINISKKERMKDECIA